MNLLFHVFTNLQPLQYQLQGEGVLEKRVLNIKFRLIPLKYGFKYDCTLRILTLFSLNLSYKTSSFLETSSNFLFIC